MAVRANPPRCDFCKATAGSHFESCPTLTTVEGDCIRTACDDIREVLDHIGLDADKLQDTDIIADYFALLEAVAAFGQTVFDYLQEWRAATNREGRWSRCICRTAWQDERGRHPKILVDCPVHGVPK